MGGPSGAGAHHAQGGRPGVPETPRPRGSRLPCVQMGQPRPRAGSAPPRPHGTAGRSAALSAPPRAAPERRVGIPGGVCVAWDAPRTTESDPRLTLGEPGGQCPQTCWRVDADRSRPTQAARGRNRECPPWLGTAGRSGHGPGPQTSSRGDTNPHGSRPAPARAVPCRGRCRPRTRPPGASWWVCGSDLQCHPDSAGQRGM